MRRRLTPEVVGYAVAAVLVLAGVAALVAGWRGAAASLDVAEQLPFLVSGSLTGLCLVISGAVIAGATQLRHAAAEERALMERAIAEADALLDELAGRR